MFYSNVKVILGRRLPKIRSKNVFFELLIAGECWSQTFAFLLKYWSQRNGELFDTFIEMLISSKVDCPWSTDHRELLISEKCFFQWNGDLL